MVVTVVLTGIPRHVPLVELADAINKFLATNEVTSFVTRETVARKGKRQVALDFKDGFNAMAAQDILNGYRYMLKDDDKEYVLSARVSKDPSVMPRGDELVPYSGSAEASSSRDYGCEVYDKLQELKKRMELVKTETEFIKAKKELEKMKKKYALDESDTETDSKRKRSKKKKKKKHKKRRRSSSSTSGSTSVPVLHSPSPSASPCERKPSKKSRRRTESSPSSSPMKRARLSPLQRVR
ncbi:hypothetical protein O0L34_g6232 [Tuta absoluta]|nr:hypothetical protein O0L34_g6232 [Tuta absoluta]